MRRTIGLGAVLVLFSLSPSIAADSTLSPALRTSLSAIPRAELPSRVAAIIRAAPPEERVATALGAVKTAVRRNRSAAPVIAGAAAQAAPNLASETAGATAREQPRQAAAIAKASAAAAPAQAGRIVIAVCRAVPAEYRNVAISVAQAVPRATQEILQAVGVVFPELKGPIESALAASGERPFSVAGVLDSARLALNSQAAFSSAGPALATSGIADKGGTTRPPFIPLSGTTGSTTGNGGGRNYATP